MAKTLGLAGEDVKWKRVPCRVRPNDSADSGQVDLCLHDVECKSLD